MRRISTYLVFSVLFSISTSINLTAQKTFGLLNKFSGNDENGYVLFTPLNCDTTYLINKCGKRVHHWVSNYPPGLSVYLLPNGHLLKAGTYTDTSFGVAGGRGGIIEEFDWNNNLVWRYKLFNDSLCQHHDIKMLPNGNILVLAWHAISKAKAISLGRRSFTFASTQNDLWGERILELKKIGTDSAEVVWQWDAFDHLIQDEDTAYPNYGQIEDHPELININYALTMQTNDWLHGNGIDYNEKLDQIVLSVHNFSELWIIDHSTTMQEAAGHSGGIYNKGGDLMYRWGNPQAYNKGSSSDRKLFRQHNANWIKGGMLDSGCIMVFNNGWGRDTAYSTVEVIQTPVLSNGTYNQALPFGPTAAKWIYKDNVPTKFYSQIISGAERLPNGNTLICSGVQGLFFEVTPQKSIVWKYKNPVYGGGLRTDGGTGNNQVFRCSFYPSNYSAFTGKTLLAGSALEKNSIPYACDYESVAPTVVALAPIKKSQ
ncbi:MAG: aryl-sulfate sulfotransferase, partial [Bacteroidia bacterium]|nr:aryl-sulfate sulfotransferase [Bacteroidia bacterium]